MRVYGPNTPFVKVKPCFSCSSCSNRDAAVAIRVAAKATLLGGQHGEEGKEGEEGNEEEGNEEAQG